MQRFRNLLDTLATLTVLIVGSYAAYGMYTQPQPSKPPTQQKEEIPKDPIPLDGLPVMGQPTAKVGILEFSDFQCPYCAKFALDTFPKLALDYISTGKVRFYFANFPLENIHKYARSAATAAICAQDFWQAHDLLFTKQSQLEDTISLIPQRIVVDEIGGGFPPECTKAVDDSIALGNKLHVTGTPTFFFGTIQNSALVVKQRVPGALTYNAILTNLKEITPQ